MDILTQYYNIDGQIIKSSPDLTTREFYRDYMCRNRFNEMFVACEKRNSDRYTATADGIYFLFDDNPGGLKYSISSWGVAEYVLINKHNGKDAAFISNPTGPVNGYNLEVRAQPLSIEITNEPVVAEIIFTLPYGNSNGAFEFKVPQDDEDQQPYFSLMAAPGSDGSLSGSVAIFGSFCTLPSIPGAASDGLWHHIKSEIDGDGDIDTYFDGYKLSPTYTDFNPIDYGTVKINKAFVQLFLDSVGSSGNYTVPEGQPGIAFASFIRKGS